MLSQREKKMICRVLTMYGVKSVVLIGSRSTRDFVKDKSDYDLYVVTPTWIVPFIYRKMKEREKKLEEKFGADVSVAPLTMSRIKRGKDLLLLKTKKEGTTICGKDYLPSIKIESINELSPDDIFSYLFSSIYFLMEYINPVKTQSEKKIFFYNISKSIMYCAEVQLFIKGRYEKIKRNIFTKAADEMKLNNDIHNSIKIAQGIMEDDFSELDDLNKLWFSAREYVLLVFQELAERFLAAKDESFKDLIERYKNTKCSFLKNFQYFVLAWMNGRRNPFLSIFSRASVEKYFHSSIFYLMLSINNDLSIDDEYLSEMYKTLSSIRLDPKKECHNKNELWEEAKNTILENWSIACGKTIL